MWRLWRPRETLQTIEGLAPRLDSWNRKDDPAQIELRRYLASLMQRVGPLPDRQPLFLSLAVDVRVPQHLTQFHDLENYLFPLFRPGGFHPARLVLAAGVKRVGGGSTLQIGVAETIDAAGLQE
ncbi:MAG: hypothetical protein QN141_13000 [Armatimonadota bacterium]|nr:hypothetical protein [Armatimonadota bacterium]MDR7452190.1 hypothetical protein [Armatimonadota bacterium]MDR7468043.1 hypothetical protein [Armatimonadota bacterium]MDR7494916.1 hypothetical protein [Armatimonadota bacterium]MDR7500366.1 hypothetical protein [Armatimonadota bacterium]